jgi:hypothetical protein
MSTIVTRSGKGSPLTHTEVDNNFTNLNTDKVESSAIGVTVQPYDADTAKLDVSQSWSAAQSFNAGVTLGDASGDALTINSSAVSIPNGLNFDSNTFVIDATNNRVGVGTASPSSAFSVLSGVDGSETIAIEAASGFATGNTTTTLRLTNSTGFGSLAGSVELKSIRDSSGTGAAFSVFSSNASSAVVERMRIDSSGNVGIGTSSSTGTLAIVNSSSANNIPFTLSNPIAGISIASTGINFNAHGVNFAQIVGGQQTNNTFADGNLRFFTRGSETVAERMRITSTGLLQFNSGYGSVATAYGCRAWVNFNGTGTVAIRGSGNVSSISDNGTGDYTVNFSTALVDANYSPVFGVGRGSTDGNAGVTIRFDTAPTASALRITTQFPNSPNTLSDFVYVNIGVFR